MRHSIVPLIVLLLTLCNVEAQNLERGFLTAPGDVVPEFSAQTVFGGEFISRDPAKATVIHVFSCESKRCEASLKALQEFLWVPLEERGLRMVGVARGATSEEASQYAADFGLTFPLVADPEGRIAGLFAVDGVGVPRTIIVNGQGEIVHQHAGFRSGREAEFRLLVDAVLENRKVPRIVAPSQSRSEQKEAYAREMIGKKAPELKVEQWLTKAPAPEEVAGKFVLMEFWATWCGPCIMTMPHLQELSEKYKDRLVIYSVSNEDPGKVREFVKENGYTYPIGTDEKGRTKEELEIRAIPHGLLVNPEGIVVWQGHPMALQDAAFLEGLLSGQAE